MSSYDDFAGQYDAGRIGYANDVYNALISYGLGPGQRILEIGCGTGLASHPLVQNGFDVTGVDISEPMLAIAKRNLPRGNWMEGNALQLPFADASFDQVISAQTFHHFDRAVALREVVRVLRPAGRAAIWWKQLSGDDPVKQLRDQVVRDLGQEPFHSGLAGGFKEFYAASLSAQTLRVVPWRTFIGVNEFMQYERSRKIVRDRLASRADAYFSRLEARLRETFGAGDPIMPLSYMHYLYLGRRG